MSRSKLNTKLFGRGVTSIEVVIGVSIAGIILVYSVYAIMQFINSARDISEKTEAVYLAEDGLEILRFIRDENWNAIGSLPVNTNRYLFVNSATTTVTTTPETIGSYTRSFRVQNVYRNSNDDIVASTTSGSVADASTRYIFMTVSWDSPVKTLTLTSILADIEP